MLRIWFKKIDKHRAKLNMLYLITIIYWLITEFHWGLIALMIVSCMYMIDSIYERTVKDWTYTLCIYFK